MKTNYISEKFYEAIILGGIIGIIVFLLVLALLTWFVTSIVFSMLDKRNQLKQIELDDKIESEVKRRVEIIVNNRLQNDIEKEISIFK